MLPEVIVQKRVCRQSVEEFGAKKVWTKRLWGVSRWLQHPYDSDESLFALKADKTAVDIGPQVIEWERYFVNRGHDNLTIGESDKAVPIIPDSHETGV